MVDPPITTLQEFVNLENVQEQQWPRVSVKEKETALQPDQLQQRLYEMIPSTTVEFERLGDYVKFMTCNNEFIEESNASNSLESIVPESPGVVYLEFASYQPFEEPLLPNNISPKTLISKLKFDEKLPKKTLERWKRILKECDEMVIYCFWWILHKVWKPTEYKLDTNISAHYKQLFEDFKGMDKDLFFDNFPDLISQMVYNAFYECFPTSFSAFEGDFPIVLCDSFTELFSGIIRTTPSCTHWRYVKEEREKELLDILGKRSQQTPSSCMEPSKPSAKSKFDIYKTSPLIAPHVPQNKPFWIRKRIVQRSEPNGPTFRSFISESNQKANDCVSTIENKQLLMKRDQLELEQDYQEFLVKNEEKNHKLLQDKEAVKIAADKLVSYYTKRRFHDPDPVRVIIE